MDEQTQKGIIREIEKQKMVNKDLAEEILSNRGCAGIFRKEREKPTAMKRGMLQLSEDYYSKINEKHHIPYIRPTRGIKSYTYWTLRLLGNTHLLICKQTLLPSIKTKNDE